MNQDDFIFQTLFIYFALFVHPVCFPYESSQTACGLPLSITRPKSEASLFSVEQFHLWSRKWCWHSSTPRRAPSPSGSMTSGCMRHRRLCLPTRPGMVSHSTPAPSVCRLSWLINLVRRTWTHQ